MSFRVELGGHSVKQDAGYVTWIVHYALPFEEFKYLVLKLVFSLGDQSLTTNVWKLKLDKY